MTARLCITGLAILLLANYVSAEDAKPGGSAPPAPAPLDPMASPFDDAEAASPGEPLDVIKEVTFGSDVRTVSPPAAAAKPPAPMDAVQTQKPLQTAPVVVSPPIVTAPIVAQPVGPPASANAPASLPVKVMPTEQPVAAPARSVAASPREGVAPKGLQSSDPYAVLPNIPIRPVNYVRDATASPVMAKSTKDAANEQTQRMSPIAAPASSPAPFTAPVRTAAAAKPSEQKEPLDESAQLQNSEVVLVRPGANTLITVAREHLNRIATPFTRVNVKTTSGASIEARQSVLYVAPNDEQPIVLYLTQDGQEDPAITITLVPRRVPPHPVRLTFDALTGPLSMRGSPDAEQWESEQPYIETLKNLMQLVASGRVPPGYQLRKRNNGDPGVLCADPALRVDPAQILEGGKLVVTVATVRNISGQNIEIQESSCYLPGVVTVAAWPTPFLKPGEASELFVVHKRDESARRSARERPSLINEKRR